MWLTQDVYFPDFPIPYKTKMKNMQCAYWCHVLIWRSTMAKAHVYDFITMIKQEYTYIPFTNTVYPERHAYGSLFNVFWRGIALVDFSHIPLHYNDVIMSAMASQITSLTIVYSTVYSDADQRKHQSSASLAFVRGIHRWPVASPHQWPITRKFFPFDDVTMKNISPAICQRSNPGEYG